MKFQRRSSEPVSLNLTPLIDVVFLLLIFFMVSTTFDQSSELDLQLPEAVNGQSSDQATSLKVEVPESGPIYLNGEAVEDLAQSLERFLEAETVPERVVVIADERARHGQVTQVLDALAGAGLSQVSFQTRYAP
ncbi:ExbD/TolR family protein [Oceanospirillum sanctuarii]|uniref:ExbD/TolR family protein n=1 Tax=Oceanospirillum sanctuarii TaxID=1434821 RepID=UPI000A3BF69A|nr:biopolymer transporter ExbD [Oceanospirillum sanctuarii]